MESEDVAISLTTTELELLLTALAYFEMKLINERPEHVLESMRSLRAKMLGELRAVSHPVSP